MTRIKNQITLQEVEPGDLPALAEMHCQIWPKAYADIFSAEKLQQLRQEDFLASWQERMAENCWRLYWVCQAGERTGFVVYGETGDKVMEIKSFYFLPAYWGMGVADAAMQELLRRSREGGNREIILWVLEGNKRAQQFYRRHGFSLTPETQTRERLGFTIKEVHMRQQIASWLPAE